LLVLSNSIKLGGSTLKDYKKTDGTIGNFQTSFKVYGRHKQQCFVCQNPIIKIIQNQRSSFYCNICQT
jgi:formamidopyrimidine-DNA glycosylase